MKFVQMTKIPMGGGQRPALLGKLTDFRGGSRTLLMR